MRAGLHHGFHLSSFPGRLDSISADDNHTHGPEWGTVTMGLLTLANVAHILAEWGFSTLPMGHISLPMGHIFFFTHGSAFSSHLL